MSLNGNNVIGSSGHRTNQPPYEIDQSLRLDGFPGTTNQHLERSPSSSGNRKTFTISFWHKPSLFAKAENDHYIKVRPDANNQFQVSKVASNDQLLIYIEVGNTGKSLQTTRVFRDPSSWYHFVIAVDTTQSTASNRVKLYVNGVQETDFGTEQYPDQDWELPYNQSGVNQDLLWSREDSGRSPSGYFAEWHSIDGQALTPASFGETNADTNQWQAIKYAGSYGTNGFYLKFQDSSALGDDSSGNTNDFTSTNLATTDQVLDSPTNNFCTGNPLFRSNSPVANQTYSEGNLKLMASGAYSYAFGVSNFAPSSGKWYCEVSGITNNQISIGAWKLSDLAANAYYNTTTQYRWFGNNGVVYNGSSAAVTTYSTWTTGDVIGIALDLDNNKLYFAKNGTWQNSGNPATGTNPVATDITDQWVIGIAPASGAADGAVFNFGQDSSFAGAKTAQGNQDGNSIGDFYYTPPSGYLALCTDNLSDPSIADPTDHFATTLYTGDGNSTQSISTEGNFDPEFAWVKIRSGSWGADNHVLYDIVRGDGKRLQSNTTGAESDLTSYGNQVAFATGGITVGSTNSGYNGQVNENSNLYVNWNWKAGGTAVSNTDGSITSSVSANTTAGFSIVAYTGITSSGTVGHGLSQAPELVIVKPRSYADNWRVGSDELTSWVYHMRLNTTDAETSYAAIWNSTAPTSTVFSSGTDGTGGRVDDYIAYCFHSVDGYSKVGSYTANGNADGPFIYTGFRPAYTIIKPYSRADNWAISDSVRSTYNGSTNQLRANNNEADFANSASAIDYLSNGFKIRTNDPGLNNSTSDTYIYLAFAESPFKTSNAR